MTRPVSLPRPPVPRDFRATGHVQIVLTSYLLFSEKKKENETK